MFDSLPQKVKQEIIAYLANGNFISAKAIYDQWCRNQSTAAS